MKCAVYHSVTVLTLASLSLPGAMGQSRVEVVQIPYAVETGAASWYGKPHHGKATASGEIYDMEQMTGAHRTLPFGTWVKVENLENHRIVDLRINDRGPFVEDRIIDVSFAGARALGILGLGRSRVRIEVQVGTFGDRNHEERLQHEMESLCGSAAITGRCVDPILWQVLSGGLANGETAASLARRVRVEGIPSAGAALIVRFSPGSLRSLY